MKNCKGMNEQIGKAVEAMAQIIEDITVMLKEAQEEKDNNKITVGDVVQNDNRIKFTADTLTIMSEVAAFEKWGDVE